jgi:hypothetical protein
MMESFYQRAKKLPKPEPKVETIVETKVETEFEQTAKPQESSRAAVDPVEFETPKYGQKNMSDNSQSDSGILSWAKKIMTVGVGTFFLTEDSLKSMISEFKLPKEMMGTILEGAKNVRHEFMQNVVQEVMSKVSDKMDPAAVLAEFLRKNEVTFEVKIKVKEKTDTDS